MLFLIILGLVNSNSPDTQYNNNYFISISILLLIVLVNYNNPDTCI